MTIEERMKLALQDFEGAMHDGQEVGDALHLIAQDYELKPDVLKVRAEQAFGDLAETRDRLILRASKDRINQEFRSRAWAFADRHFSWAKAHPSKILNDVLDELGERKGLDFRDIIMTQNWANETFSDDIERANARACVMKRLRQLYREANYAPNQ